ncbi:MAG TPA: hypothetical protein VF407_12425 [Polyangiaceae bacterium]
MEERSTVAGGLALAACGALFFAGVGWWYFGKDIDNERKVEIEKAAKVAEAGLPFVSAEEKQQKIFDERARLDRDRTALKTKKPKTRADVEKLIGAPDACKDDGSGGTYCLWYYADKPDNEPKDQIGVTFKGDKVGFVDN